ncbi:hypothetical protein [Bifidobacterium leontopitheci]|uniref:hypothetical protein n=1 Tax=Bifidobacterium leontopitheci TaxID=2650774 RepID=UPI001264608A|nr:hypothetical protein [Bifidobacterium leontopitheci]
MMTCPFSGLSVRGISLDAARPVRCRGLDENGYEKPEAIPIWTITKSSQRNGMVRTQWNVQKEEDERPETGDANLGITTGQYSMV